MADEPDTKIELFFTSVSGELDSISVISGGHVVHKGNLSGKIGVRRKLRKRAQEKPKLKNRKISALGLLVCKQDALSSLRLHESERPWKVLLRIFKDRRKDPIPKWVHNVYAGFCFDFYVRPKEEDQELMFHATAHQRIRVMIGSHEADQQQLKSLVAHYRCKCHNDATAIVTDIIPDVERRRQMQNIATKVADFAMDENMATMIGKFIWYCDWGKVYELVSTKGDKDFLGSILIESRKSQWSLTDASDIQPLCDLLVRFRHRYEELMGECPHLFDEAGPHFDEIVARNSANGVHGNQVRSMTQWLEAIDTQYDGWNKFLKAELDSTSAPSQSLLEPIRMRSQEFREAIWEETGKLVKALREFQLLVIKKRSQCREDFKTMTELLAPAPRDEVDRLQRQLW